MIRESSADAALTLGQRVCLLCMLVPVASVTTHPHLAHCELLQHDFSELDGPTVASGARTPPLFIHFPTHFSSSYSSRCEYDQKISLADAHAHTVERSHSALQPRPGCPLWLPFHRINMHEVGIKLHTRTARGMKKKKKHTSISKKGAAVHAACGPSYA